MKEINPHLASCGDGSLWQETDKGWRKLTKHEINNIEFDVDGRPCLPKESGHNVSGKDAL